MSGNREWHPQGDYQTARIDGKSVVLARGGTFSARRRAQLPLWVMATCGNHDDAERIVKSLTEAGES